MTSGVKSLHFYTMNLATAVTNILRGLGLNMSPMQRDLNGSILSMRNSRIENRYEEIRPIFWANRQSSYIARTSEWDDFPNGRWGNRRSPAFGELSEYYLAYKRKKVDRKEVWGVPTSHQDVWNVFVGYIQGTVRQVRRQTSGPCSYCSCPGVSRLCREKAPSSLKICDGSMPTDSSR